MASLTLRSLLSQRSSTRLGETNLERGKIWVYTPGTHVSQFSSGCFCWTSPDDGTAVVEIWGASGSGARSCCCGGGLPGNPGAYSKKTVAVKQGDFIRGIVGMSCGNSSTINFRGCSESTCITVCSPTDLTCSCMCAQGGYGGWTFCVVSEGTLYCCFMANGFCQTFFSACCGIICNVRPDAVRSKALAFGGDVNKEGGVSCTTFKGRVGNTWCCWQYNTQTSPGVISEDGAVVTYNGEGNSSHGMCGGNQAYGTMSAGTVAGKQPSRGGVYVAGCWASTRMCGCYEMNGCLPTVPYGYPGGPGQFGGDVRDGGMRGGHGAVRIKFIGSE